MAFITAVLTILFCLFLPWSFAFPCLFFCTTSSFHHCVVFGGRVLLRTRLGYASDVDLVVHLFYGAGYYLMVLSSLYGIIANGGFVARIGSSLLMIVCYF